MKFNRSLFAALLPLLMLIILAGCSSWREEPKENTVKESQEKPLQEGKLPEQQTPQVQEKDVEEIDFSKIRPNENGQVMILMYHGIGEKEEEWVRTPENFRKDLDVLYEKGYRLISLKDYIENNIQVEAGLSPVVLAFDDGLLNQFNIIEENGQKRLDPDCAVGILEDFKKRHPDFGAGGSFFVYYPLPFRQKALIKDKYDFLIQNGYDIGNHSYTHENLGKLDAQGVQKALALNVKQTLSYLPDYDVYALALPYGIGPKGDDYKYAAQGTYQDTSYNHRAILKVGSNPAYSPVSLKYDPLKLPRVRASEANTAGVGMYDWLAVFDKYPHRRFISDGDPDTITIPESEKENINRDSLKGKTLRTYKLEE